MKTIYEEITKLNPSWLTEFTDKITKLISAAKKELKRELNKLNAELDSIVERITDLDEKISAKEQEIAETQAALDEARTIEHNQYESMKKRIQFMYKDSRNLYLDILFQAKSFTDLITLSSYMEALATYDKDKFDEYQETRKTIEILEAKLREVQRSYNPVLLR